MLKTNICGVEFRNPLMLAAGIMGSNASSMNWILKSGAGGVVPKSFSLNPYEYLVFLTKGRKTVFASLFMALKILLGSA